MRKLRVIAIDGPAGAGKSTVAREVARRLGFRYVDTGATYRAATWKAIQAGADLLDERALADLTRATDIQLSCDGDATRVYVDGREVTEEIRHPALTAKVRYIARAAPAREVLVALQRRIAGTTGAVLEGRDIGTVVFPDAACKIFLDAAPRERAQRRHKDLEATGHQVNVEELEKEVVDRDLSDMNRSASPLKRAEDAVVLDTTELSFEEVVERVIAIAKERMKDEG